MSVIDEAVELIKLSDSILVTAGAGMGVDSGLPDFRGENGFWEAYPSLGKRRISFTKIANPFAFRDNPKLAWGFYGHRLNLYKSTTPHAGFAILKQLGELVQNGLFVITSNVDGHFQKAGFPDHRVMEIHGSIHFFQCMRPCKECLWPAGELQVDHLSCSLESELPICPWCSGPARPNILMFDDWLWIPRRLEIQRNNWHVWKSVNKRTLVIEIGAGSNIPSIRKISQNQKTNLIRINPDAHDDSGFATLRIRMGALQALSEIAENIKLSKK